MTLSTQTPARPASSRVHRLMSRTTAKWAAFIALPLVVAVSFFAVSAPSPPVMPLVALASEPLYAATTADKPTLALALSVEYPTVGAQYVWDGSTGTGSNSHDDAYTNVKEYLGYYDAEACYKYNNAPTETPAAPLTTADYKRFDRIGGAIALTVPDIAAPYKTSRMCADGFSGNFLNWASNSAIDMLRLALSGGDRYIDTATHTILQRAVIPNGDPICMWNTTNFPSKHLRKDGGGTGKYWGAIPQSAITAANGNDVWVANTLNRMYFRAANNSAGSCTDTTGYTLFGAPSSGNIGPITNESSKPGSAIECANENQTCSGIPGTREVWYGAVGSWKRAPIAGGSVACINAVFGDPISGTAKKCFYADSAYTGTWSPSSSDGFLYARVSVCDKNSTTGALLDDRDYGLCQRYPNGNFKPTGVIQKYSEQMRLATFGYLLDQNRNRYGGVLRTPMKYVGAKTFDISGVESSAINNKAEWNVNNGVFLANPDGDAMGISGVVNYLNKFGRTGATPGRYKIYDPVSDLYYETLRYLQGLPPSAAAISGIDTTMKDGFPVFTDWSDSTGVGDPYGGGRSNTSSYSCQKNNIVVIGDVNTHDNPGSFPSTNVAANIPNIDYWTGIVGSFERGNATNYTDGQGVTRTTSNPNTLNGNPKGDKIVGMSYWAHTQDIRGTAWTDKPAAQRWGLRTKTFIFDVNEYADQNNVNTRRYNNQFFTAAKYGGFESDPANLGAKPYNTWGHPFKQEDGVVNNNVWQKPTDPGEASTYYLQSSARGVLSAFDEIFSRATTSARSIAGSAVQSKNLREQFGNAIYQGTFDTADWSGDLLSIPVSVNAANAVTISPTNNWTAATKLGQMATPATSRTIVVGRPGGNANPTARNFLWNSIDSDLQTQLDKAAPTATADGLGSERLLYLRGKRALEGTIFRLRNKLLGDIINSGVVFSGKPTMNISSAGSSSYSSFASTVNALNNGAGRTPAVFVGANDGMLHAFEATTGQTSSGQELFGFIPSWMGPKLSALTRSDYINNHQAYVDGPPEVADALVGQSPDVWKTVLVSGTGAGGRGVFALDVTDPSAFDASKVMWEFTQADDVDMGFVIGRPKIVKIRTSPTASAPVYRWFAAVPSGVNNYKDDGAGRFSTTGEPVLFLLALDKAPGVAWTTTGAGANYYKIVLPVNITAIASGLANFSTSLGKVGEAAQMYMGDLHGNMWKLDFELAVNGTADWALNKLSPFVKSGVPYPLYIARDGTPAHDRQPITMAPSLIRGETNKSTYVAFGTGKYLELADKSTGNKQSVYAVFDHDDDPSPDQPITNTATQSTINGRDRLKAGTTNITNGTVTVGDFTWGRPLMTADLTTTSLRSGWYFDFPYAGERQVSNAKSVGDYLVFSSLIPGASSSSGSCSAGGGGGAEYTINIDKGPGSFRLSNVGVLGEPLVMEIPGATRYSAADNTGRRKKTVVTQTIQQGSTGLAATTSVTTEFVVGRLSWRQINNYQDRKLAP